MKNKILKNSILINIILIISKLFWWYIEDIIPFFLIPFIIMIAYLIVTVNSILVIIWFFASINQKSKKYYAINLIYILSIIAYIYIPILSTKLEYNFNKYYNLREKVVLDIKKDIQNNKYYNRKIIKLHTKYDKVSVDGEIFTIINQNGIQIFFYIHRGMFDDYSGFLYTNVNPINYDKNKKYTELKRNWFLVE